MADELIFISTAARMLGMHPQTLRKYERLGLVRPARTIGSMRLYSRDEIERLRYIKRLVDDMGVNLAGVQQLLEIAEVMAVAGREWVGLVFFHSTIGVTKKFGK